MSETLTPLEFLELVAGERCPCGHSKDEHATPGGPTDKLPDGMREVMGPCTQCECRGVIE